MLAKIAPDHHEFTEYFEDDCVTDVPARLQLALTSNGDVELDYAGSDPQVQSALNMPTGSATASDLALGHSHSVDVAFGGVAHSTCVDAR